VTRAFQQKDLAGLRFLVTGGAGFIGSNLVSWLLGNGAGHVRVLDDLSTGTADNLAAFRHLSNFEFIQGDIRDPETCKRACQGIHYISHQAALGSVPRSVKDPLATHSVNATGFLNMLTAAKDAGVRRFVYASSSSVYGDHPGLPKREEELGRPLSPYAVSKLTNELYATVFAPTYGIECIGLRYFNVFGPNQRPEGPYAAVIPLFMKAALNNTSAQIDGDGEQTRDFTYVDNAVQANLCAFFSSHPEAVNTVYNVAVGERISINQLYSIIYRLAGSECPAIHRTARTGDIRNSLADISKAEQLLGYHPTIRVEEGLKTTLDWFKGQAF
jgi:UDP-N-acetylglucosamine 4-epimerase